LSALFFFYLEIEVIYTFSFPDLDSKTLEPCSGTNIVLVESSRVRSSGCSSFGKQCMDGTSESIYRDRGRRGRGVSEQTGGGVEEEEPEAAMSFVGVVVGRGEEGGAVAIGGEDHGGVVQWRRYFPSLVAPLSVIGS
jgi:hypothetical protein